MVKSIFDKVKINKSYTFPNDIEITGETLERNKKQIKYLKNLPQYPQKSPEWLAQRKNMLTASNMATIVDLNPYSSSYEYMKEKIGLKAGFSGNAASIKGNKYEEIAGQVYKYIYGKRFYEYGLIAHPELSYVGASPDGIRKDGVMMEIKCPSSRVITGNPPHYYWIQTQIQMECCDFEHVHFIECRFEDINEDEFKEILTKNCDDNRDNYIFAGCFLTMRNFEEEKEWEQYPERLDKPFEYFDEWLKEKYSEIEDNDNVAVMKRHYWKLSEMCINQIDRDRQWWVDNKQRIINFWNDVEYYRENINEFKELKGISKHGSFKNEVSEKKLSPKNKKSKIAKMCLIDI